MPTRCVPHDVQELPVSPPRIVCQPPRSREALAEASGGSGAPSTVMSSSLLSRLRASHFKIPSPPLNEGPPEGTPQFRVPAPLHALPFRASSPSRPPRSLRCSQPVKYRGLRATAFRGATAGTCPSHSRGSARPWSPPRSSLPPRSPAAAHLAVKRPPPERRGILGVVVRVPLTCRSQGSRGRQK